MKIFKKIRQYLCDHEYYEQGKVMDAAKMDMPRMLYRCPKCGKQYVATDPKLIMAFCKYLRNWEYKA